MAETSQKKQAEKNQRNKTLLIVAVVALAAIIFLLVQHMILTARANAAAEAAYQQGLEEADTSIETIIVNDEITVDVATLREVVSAASKLTAYEYYYTDVGVYEKSEKLFNTNIRLPFTTDKTLYTYSGKVGAGIELNDVGFEVNNDTKVIVVTFPEPKILSHEMGKEFEFYDIKKAAFKPSNFNDFEEFRSELMKRQEEALSENGEFWKSVRNNTETIVKGLVTASGKIEGYTIICDW